MIQNKAYKHSYRIHKQNILSKTFSILNKLKSFLLRGFALAIKGYFFLL